MSISEDNLIKFTAICEKVQTLADGGIRITLDLDAGAIEQAAALMQARRINALTMLGMEVEDVHLVVVKND